MAGQPGPMAHPPHEEGLVRHFPGRAKRGSLWPMVVAGAMTAVLAGCVGDEVPEVSADDAQLVTGREVYARNCVACHGAAGQGGTGPKLSDGVVIDRYPDVADHVGIIVNGKNQMPAYGGKLSDEEIEAVVRYNREVL